MEIHKTPRDTWTKELESALSKSTKRLQNNDQINAKPSSPTGQTVRVHEHCCCVFMAKK